MTVAAARLAALGHAADFFGLEFCGVVFSYLCGTDTVAKLSPLIHDARRLSDGHVDDVAATWSHEDAIDAAGAPRSGGTRRPG